MGFLENFYWSFVYKLQFLILGFYGFFCVSVCACMFIYFLWYSLFFVCLPVLKERKKSWDCMNGEKSRIWEELGRGTHDQKRLYKN